MRCYVYKLPQALFLFLISAVLRPAAVQAQCSGSGTALIVTAANTVVNTYYPGTATAAAGSRSITLGTSTGAGAIAPGDVVLIIQMQGSNINSANTDVYGNGVAGGPGSGELGGTAVAGTWEYGYAVNAVPVGGGTLRLAGPIKNTYTNAVPTATTNYYRFQVIRVPQYSTLDFSFIGVIAGTITAPAWNGITGGVVAFDANAVTTGGLGGTAINASGIGFRGAAGRQLGGASGLASSDYRSLATVAANGGKGEGTTGPGRYLRTPGTTDIVDYGAVTIPDGSNGRGAPGNAGGGGNDGNPASNDQNAGGGGGGNGGAGGNGGNTWSSNLAVGGFGGAVPSYLSATRLILGGGGGSGTTNDGGIGSSGAAGGGIIVVRAGTITRPALAPTSSIFASGSAAEAVANDGGGGGGAGGTVYITVKSGTIPFDIQANGGRGGNAWATQAGAASAHGPGGGGGGGVIRTNAAATSTAVLGGANGITTTGNLAYNAQPGAVGVTSVNLASNSLPLTPICDTDDDDDGIPDNLEYAASVFPLADGDGDGIPNAFDPTPGTGLPAWVDVNSDLLNDYYDSDLDGIMNSFDLDSDNDGIPDLVEAGGTDTNGDGIADVLTDTDGDGLSNTYDTDNGGTALARPDTDGDGVRNFLDRDSDNDGISDIVESGGADTDGDGRADGTADADHDGLLDQYDNTTGGTRIALLNNDGGTLPNYLDLDSDGDGIPDIIEAGGTDSNNDGLVDSFADSDGDGFHNAYDGDANGDGIAENTAGALIITGAGNAAGVPSSYPRANFDGTGLPNPFDLDSDGDGINDVREAGFPDTDGNGLSDGATGATTGWSTTIDALASLGLLNSDTDPLFDYLDIDADNDGITDNVEYQLSAGYIPPSGADSDGDGIDNAYDGLSGNGDSGDAAPYNHDGVDLPDYRDANSDNDKLDDIVEGNDFNGNGINDDLVTLTGVDADNDGLDNRFDQQTGPVVTVAGYVCPSTPTSCPTAGSRSTVQQTPSGAPNRDWRNALYALPVTLVNFSGQERASIVTLRWTVEMEESFKEYVVERSLDANTYQAVDTVAARGLIERQEYQTTDNIAGVNTSPVYYRLKMVDINGRFTYSAPIRIVIGGKLTNGVKVTPNPVGSTMQVRITSGIQQQAQVTIISNQGQVIYQAKQQVFAGENNLSMSSVANSLPSGTYMVKVIMGGESYVVKFVK